MTPKVFSSIKNPFKFNDVQEEIQNTCRSRSQNNLLPEIKEFDVNSLVMNTSFNGPNAFKAEIMKHPINPIIQISIVPSPRSSDNEECSVSEVDH